MAALTRRHCACRDGTGGWRDHRNRHSSDCVIVLAVLALVVVKALIGSLVLSRRSGRFRIALLMGIYNQFIRPGRIGEVRPLGRRSRGADLWQDRVGHAGARRLFRSQGETLALIIIGYGFVASVLPVWLLWFSRLSFDIPGNWYHRAAGHRHHHRSSRSPDAGLHQVH